MAKAKTSASKGKQNQGKNSKLPLFLLLGGALILLIVAFFAFQKKAPSYISEVSGVPSLKTDKDKIDLGDVKLGKTVQVAFEFTNIGDKPLQFSKAPYIEVLEGC